MQTNKFFHDELMDGQGRTSFDRVDKAYPKCQQSQGRSFLFLPLIKLVTELLRVFCLDQMNVWKQLLIATVAPTDQSIPATLSGCWVSRNSSAGSIMSGAPGYNTMPGMSIILAIDIANALFDWLISSLFHSLVLSLSRNFLAASLLRPSWPL